MQNGPFVVLLGLAVAFAYHRFGGEWILNVVKAGLGIGFIIFIHELGHFLAAKWCDVHVVTFSIGFGPAVPGCSFTRGETTYKLAILPIGGFVNMVGEGPEADEEEDYPRSFKNKTVFQRMLIISAGVIMNVAFGMACFIGVYLTTGVTRKPAVVSQTSPGSPAWQNGLRAGLDPDRDRRPRRPLVEPDARQGRPLVRGQADPVHVHRPRRQDPHPPDRAVPR